MVRHKRARRGVFARSAGLMEIEPLFEGPYQVIDAQERLCVTRHPPFMSPTLKRHKLSIIAEQSESIVFRSRLFPQQLRNILGGNADAVRP